MDVWGIFAFQAPILRRTYSGLATDLAYGFVAIATASTSVFCAISDALAFRAERLASIKAASNLRVRTGITLLGICIAVSGQISAAGPRTSSGGDLFSTIVGRFAARILASEIAYAANRNQGPTKPNTGVAISITV